MEESDNRKKQRVEDLTIFLVRSVKKGSLITCPQNYTQKEKNHFYSLKKAARSCFQKLMDYKPGFEPDQDVSKKLTRAAFCLAYDQCDAKFTRNEKMYTEFELRQAIFTALTNPNMPYAWTRGCDESKKLVFPTSLNIEFEYGVPKTTYYTKVVDFKSTFKEELGDIPWGTWIKEEANVLAVLSHLEDYDFNKPGPRPLLPIWVIDMIRAQACIESNMGNGWTRDMLQIRVSDLVKAVYEDLAAEGLVDKMKCKNHVSKTYIMQRIVKNPKCMGTGKAGFTKDSSLSPERAKASNPAIMSCFTKEVMKKDAELIAEGVFPPGGLPAERIFNLDETGFDPNGKFAATFHCNKDSNSRSFQIMKGEQHAPFWVTLLVAISATGQLLNPMLIFQGGKDITADKIGDVSTERKRKFPSASSSSVSAESPTCRFPSIEKNTREIKSSSASSSSVAAESPTCTFPSIGKNTREHSAVREENPYEKMFAPRNGSKHTGRGE